MIGLRLADCWCGLGRCVCVSAGHATCTVQCWEKELGAELFVWGLRGQEGLLQGSSERGVRSGSKACAL